MSFVKIGDAQPINTIISTDIDVDSIAKKFEEAKKKAQALPNKDQLPVNILTATPPEEPVVIDNNIMDNKSNTKEDENKE